MTDSWIQVHVLIHEIYPIPAPFREHSLPDNTCIFVYALHTWRVMCNMHMLATVKVVTVMITTSHGCVLSKH